MAAIMTQPDRWRLYLPLFLCLMATPAWGQPARAVSACATAKTSLEQSAQVLLDETGDMTPAQIMQLPDSAFRHINAGQYLGNGSDVWWLRLRLSNTGAESCQRWLVVAPARIGDVRVYVPKGTGWQRMVAGAFYPFHEWALPERRPAFPVRLEPGVTTVLAQVVSKGQTLALTPQLWAPEQF